ncbi:MAG: hypothetical protein EXS00_03370 [Phycisphaerales bacterium]|nr:hypothetical protein [Phycisphaerales bacterium]
MSTISDLKNLNRADAQVRALRSRVDSARSNSESAQSRLDIADNRRNELQSQSRQLQATLDNQEQESKVILERIERLRADLNTSTNTKQYTALLTEMKSLQDGRDKIDDVILAHMQKLETLSAEANRSEEAVTAAQAVRDQSDADLKERQTDVGERLAELEIERTKAARHLSSDNLKLFEAVAMEHDGDALSEIIVVSKRHREYACSECNMLVPQAYAAKAAANEDSIVLCPSCKRILLFIPPVEE